MSAQPSRPSGSVHKCVPTFLLEEHSALGYDNRDVAVDVGLAIIVDEGDGNVGICYALAQRHAKDTGGFRLCIATFSFVFAPHSLLVPGNESLMGSSPSKRRSQAPE